MSNGTVAPTYYADFGGLEGLKRNVKANDPKAIRAVAQQFESLFTTMMLKSMRAAKLGEGLGDSQQSDLYQDMYDQQVALKISQGKGIGLADMLVQQLTRAGAAKAAAGAISGPSAATAPAAAAAPAVTDAQKIGFVQQLTPLATQAGAQLGVSADTLIAQAALETGWGRSMPTDSNGRSSANLFGVKAGESWRGASVQATTTEYDQGIPSSTPAAFRSYDDTAQSVGDYVSLLQTSPRYAGALGTGSDVHAFASGLQRGGYATDPDYVNKLVATVATLRQLRAAGLKS